MKTYIGTKIIRAEPMDEFVFRQTVHPRHSMLEIDSKGASKPGYKVVYPNGYVSWSPKDVFELAYREITIEEKVLI